MKKILSIIAIIACSVAGLIALPTSGAWAITCPAGTRNKGKEMKSLAECDLKISGTEAKQVTNKVNKAISVIIGMVGVVAVVVVILGGIQFVTSQGDVTKAAKAKNTILYGVIGAVICVLAYAIVNFVLTGVFGS